MVMSHNKQIKVTDAERTENLQKNVYPVMEVVSVAVNADAEVVNRPRKIHSSARIYECLRLQGK